MVSILGLALVAVGGVMLVTPGPGVAAIIAGLALLATEYVWAQRALESVKKRAGEAARGARRRLRRGRSRRTRPSSG